MEQLRAVSAIVGQFSEQLGCGTEEALSGVAALEKMDEVSSH